MNIENLLIVINDQDDGEIVLQKAQVLSANTGATLHVVHIIYEGFAELSIHDIEHSHELKDYLMTTATDWLEHLVAPLRDTGLRIETRAVWHKSDWQAVLEIASAIKADLILKSTKFPTTEILRTPSDWSLLRHTDIPVMLVKPINWSTHPVVLAAIDTSSDDQTALNDRILQRSKHLCELLAGSLHIVSTYPSVDHWVGPVRLAINFDKVKQAVSRDIHDRIADIAATQGLTVAEIHAAEGEPEDAIRSVADQINADLTVMGTVQRTGPQGAFIGNTSEKILHRLHSDVEVLR